MNIYIYMCVHTPLKQVHIYRDMYMYYVYIHTYILPALGSFGEASCQDLRWPQVEPRLDDVEGCGDPGHVQREVANYSTS